MNGKQIKSYTGRSMSATGTFATIALLGGTLLVSSAVPVAAQTDAAVSARHTETSTGSMGTRIPGSAQQIISHIAEMWVAANQRSIDKGTPEGSRESYRAAATALRQALASAHVRPTGRGGSRYNADLLVSSGQLADDISHLKSMTARMSGPRVADLNQVAELYATGAKEFFTGLMRDALLQSPSSRSRLASTTSGDLGITSRRPNTTVPVAPLPESTTGQTLDWGLSSYGFSPDSTYWGPDLGVAAGGFGSTVVAGPGGVASVPAMGNGNAGNPVIVEQGPTVVVPPTP